MTTTPSPTAHEAAYGAQVLRDLTPLHRDLRKAIPDVYKGFGELRLQIGHRWRGRRISKDRRRVADG